MTIGEQGRAGNDSRGCEPKPRSGFVWASARSRHPGGVVVGMADGSTHFVSESIDLSIWQAMATRAGEEPLAAFGD